MQSVVLKQDRRRQVRAGGQGGRARLLRNETRKSISVDRQSLGQVSNNISVLDILNTHNGKESREDLVIDMGAKNEPLHL
jgi:hypothetical protein